MEFHQHRVGGFAQRLFEKGFLGRSRRAAARRERPKNPARTLGLCAHIARLAPFQTVSQMLVGGPNQVVSASTSPSRLGSPTQATYPSGRISMAAGAATAPMAGSSHGPTYLASISRTRSAHGA